MINTSIFLESLLQKMRFKKVRKFLQGDVLDFGGNEGELGKYVQGNYTLVNYDHAPMQNKQFDTIVMLAVIEHIEPDAVNDLFKKIGSHLKDNGILFLTTPTPASKFVLELLAWLGFLDKQNIEEHKHYWTKKELYELAELSELRVEKYQSFQLGFNQWMVLRKGL